MGNRPDELAGDRCCHPNMCDGASFFYCQMHSGGVSWRCSQENQMLFAGFRYETRHAVCDVANGKVTKPIG